MKMLERAGRGLSALLCAALCIAPITSASGATTWSSALNDRTGMPYGSAIINGRTEYAPMTPSATVQTGSEVILCAQGNALAGCNTGGTLQGLDLTGATDQSAKISAALATAKTVKLPAGVILASFTVPSNANLSGAGQCVYNRVTLAWSTNCTLVIGTVTLTGSQNATVTDLAIDAYASGGDAIDAKSDATTGFIVRRVSMRANNHNMLMEKNANTGVPATDAIGANVNNGLIEDCQINGGPNGIAIKMRGITVRRCTAYDVTVQAFVAVSDVINGVGIYSRAQDVVFDNDKCVGVGQCLHIYSRDNQSLTNTSGVLGAKNILWVNGPITGATNNDGAAIGDPTSLDATVTRIANIGITISNARIADNYGWGLNWLNLASGGYSGLTFGSNNTGATTGVRNMTYSTSGKVSRLSKGPVVVEDTDLYDRAAGMRTVQASGSLSTADLGMTVNNYLATAVVSEVLPATFQMGDSASSFYVSTTGGITVASAAPGTNAIRQGATIAAANIASTAVGSSLTLTAEYNSVGVLQWVVTAISGTWTIT